jgi:hypothetical protein
MKLTPTEIKAIHKLDAEKAIEVLHECAERLGLVSVGEFKQISGMKRRTIYDHISSCKLTSTDFCGNKLIIINDK